MIWMLAAVAEVPPEVDVEDIARWETLADAALDGPTGCWDFRGGVRVTITVHTRASFWNRASATPTVSTGNFSGRLRDGTWERFDYTLINTNTGEANDSAVYPMIGKVKRKNVTQNGEPAWDEEKVKKAQERRAKRAKQKGEPIEPTDPGNLLRSLLDSFDSSTAVSTAGWREKLQAVQLDQDVPVDDSDNPKTIHLTTLFPGGKPFPTRLSAVFPRKLTMGTWPLKVTLVDTQLHLIQTPVRDRVLPMAETASTIVNALGFTVGLEQRFDYQSATPCD